MVGYRSPRLARGVSLIEVLVAIVIFSIGILGLALMQMKGAQFTKDAGSRSNAIMLARSMADAMRANPAATHLPAAAGSAFSVSVADCPYCTAAYTTPPTVTSDCAAPTSATIAAQCDLARWRDQLEAVMPAPATSTGNPGTVAWDSTTGTYVITTSWSASKLKDSDSGNMSYSFVYLP